ncbi:hypothetical protein GOP47_0006226 [Adiantum capillus-veneris]|uniref:Chlorophyll a-b binding protein, chloroplastic n=1 Tax=Adiantum capillus-veneris TaxID=13818 RepID=A0A9D4V2G1_ADICA|nr:hypothetical protein GOP47_0006226 [Adiantum capillus-veneris]
MCACRNGCHAGDIGCFLPLFVSMQVVFLGESLSSSPVRAFKVEAKIGEWLPSMASPAYLDGNLVGDNGFDPLGLAEDPANLK